MSVSQTRIKGAAIGVLLIALFVWAFRSDPVEVDLATVQRGSFQVTIDNEGKTRVRERYIVSAPLGGRLVRIELDPGDRIEKEGAILAVIEPLDPALLDLRSRAESEARLAAAEAARDQAIPASEKAKALYEHARIEFERGIQLSEKGVLSKQEFEALTSQERVAASELRSAEFAVKIANFEVSQAQAALLQTAPNKPSEKSYRFEIGSPIKGVVLKVFEESSIAVSPGTKLLELGDPTDLDCQVDVLSSDAVGISPGQRVIFEQWGGEAPLEGRVRVREPSAFTKVSALGVEEQRVNIIVDFASPASERMTLGDGYRVEAKIVLAEAKNAIIAPSGALFRIDESWATFVVEGDRARLARVTPGLSNGVQTEILAGLSEGDKVVLHPSDRLSDEVRIVVR